MSAISEMIEHHEGAVKMAADQLKDGRNGEALALAEQIIADQGAEIEEMQTLLQSSSPYDQHLSPT